MTVTAESRLRGERARSAAAGAAGICWLLRSVQQQGAPDVRCR